MHKAAKGEINTDVTKSWGTCNGGPQFCNESTITERYTACVKQPIQRLTYAISTAMNMVCKECDVGNTFAKAPSQNVTFYMQPDYQF